MPQALPHRISDPLPRCFEKNALASRFASALYARVVISFRTTTSVRPMRVSHEWIRSPHSAAFTPAKREQEGGHTRVKSCRFAPNAVTKAPRRRTGECRLWHALTPTRSSRGMEVCYAGD